VPQNFLYPQRDQPLLLPVDMREWLPEDDLVYVVLDAVATLDLGEFRRRYRADGHGRAAFDPEMMVALLLYGYCQGERSSRLMEKRCLRDVGYRVITGGLHPDHATIARFRARHEKALGVRHETLIGTVISLSREDDTLSDGEAAAIISAEVSGRRRNVHLTLTGRQHELAIQAYGLKLPVVVTGDLTFARRTWQLEGTVELDEDMLLRRIAETRGADS